MLVGKNITLKELKEKMKGRIDGNRMELRKLADELATLNTQYNKMPKLRNEPPTAEMVELVTSIRDKEKRRTELEEQITFFRKKLDEAENAKDESQTVYLNLKDCLFYEV